MRTMSVMVVSDVGRIQRRTLGGNEWAEDCVDEGKNVRISAPAPAAPAHWPRPTLVVMGCGSAVIDVTHMVRLMPCAAVNELSFLEKVMLLGVFVVEEWS